MATDRSLDVPLEICYEIIDLLHDDKLALLNCALVCKAWVEHSRKHLWRDIHAIRLHPERDNRFSSPLHGSYDPEYMGMTFAHWTISVEEATSFFFARPHLAKLVRVLHLDGYARLTLGDLSRLVSAFPTLEGFSLHRSVVLPPDGAVQPVVPAEDDRQRPIKLSFIDCNVVLRDLDTLFHVLNLFAGREAPTLWLRGGTWNLYQIEQDGWVFDPDVDLKPGTKSLKLPVVRTLWMVEVVPGLLRYIFEQTAMTRALEDLRVRSSYPSTIDTWSDFAMMCSAVQSVAPTLRAFDFYPGQRLKTGCPAELTGLLDVAVRDVAGCSGLKTITLWMNHMREHRPHDDLKVTGSDYYALFNAYCRIIGGLPQSAALETFKVTFILSHPTMPESPGSATPLEVIKGCDWAGLEAVLTPMHRRRIKVLLHVIICPEVESPEDLERDLFAFFRESLPNLAAVDRVLLAVSFPSLAAFHA